MRDASNPRRGADIDPRREAAILLFDDDFDQPAASPMPPEPEIIEPVFTAAELEAAREEAAREAREAALAEAGATSRGAAREALASIAAAMTAASEEAAALAEETASSLAGLLLACFAAAFPALSARHGPEEAAAVVRQVLPALHREPKVTIRVNPRLAGFVVAEIEASDPDLAARVRIVPTEAMAVGDTRIAWDNGAATRDTKAVWERIESILSPAGLLPAGSLPTGSLPTGSLPTGSLNMPPVAPTRTPPRTFPQTPVAPTTAPTPKEPTLVD